MPSMQADLETLAAAYGVATSYRDGAGTRHDVAPETVVAILAQFEVDASTEGAIRAALDRLAAARRQLPATVVTPAGRAYRLPAGRAELTLEDGHRRTVDGALPADLPLGYHHLTLGTDRATVIVVPERLPDPPRAWGFAVQLFALHSADSWGVGDLGDLRALGRATPAEALLLNPLSAVNLVGRVEASPYSPSSRRYLNPVYLRIADLPEYRAASPDLRAAVDALRPPSTDPIDYDAVWAAKRGALEALWPLAGSPPAEPDVVDFATFCALAEAYGPRWRDWPAELRRPDGPGVARARDERADRVAFHAWVQRRLREQLAAAGTVGPALIHDLPVGVHPDGADAWAYADVLAGDVAVGAPPDAFNPLGQNWGLPPWRPDRLAEAGYAPYRDTLRAVLAYGGGLRVDHIAGLWRLWWVPPGKTPDRGTYVRYDADALLGILALEAHRAGTYVIGEDLGTVEPAVTEALHARNMLGSTVLWFARDAGRPERPFRPPATWPGLSLATVTTHDLPTARGFLEAEHVRVRAALGIVEAGQAAAEAAADRAALLDLLRSEGLLAEGATDEDLVVALHAVLGRSPCRVRLAYLTDATGDVRQPNLPGTTGEYPNWRLPLPVPLEDLTSRPLLWRIAAAVRGDDVAASTP